MAKYLLLEHDRGAPAPVNNVPMDRWTPEEIDAHVQFMSDFAARLERTGELVDGQALSPDGVWGRSDGVGRPPVTDGPFAETKDLVAGWIVIDVDSHQCAIELAAELSAAPGARGEPIDEWLEVRPFPAEDPTSPLKIQLRPLSVLAAASRGSWFLLTGQCGEVLASAQSGEAVVDQPDAHGPLSCG